MLFTSDTLRLFGVWGLTVAVLALHRGFVGAMKVFGLPAILFLEVALLVFQPIAVPTMVTVFASWSVGGIELASNWFVLIITSFLFVYGLTFKRLGLH
jgi:hypothetical protein